MGQLCLFLKTYCSIKPRNFLLDYFNFIDKAESTDYFIDSAVLICRSRFHLNQEWHSLWIFMASPRHNLFLSDFRMQLNLRHVCLLGMREDVLAKWEGMRWLCCVSGRKNSPTIFLIGFRPSRVGSFFNPKIIQEYSLNLGGTNNAKFSNECTNDHDPNTGHHILFGSHSEWQYST